MKYALILGLALSCQASSHAQSPLLTNPFSLPGDDTVQPAAGTKQTPLVAPGADCALAVWTDWRATSQDPQSEQDIYALRVSAAGQALDAVPIALATAAGAQTNPRAAWNGSCWLVTWESQDFNGSYYASAIRGLRIAADGTKLDAQPIVIRPPQWSSGLMYDLCSNGSSWLVVSEGTSAGENDLVGQRIAANGQVLDTTPVVLVPATYYLFFYVRVASAGGEYLLSWSGASSQRGRRFSSALAPLASEFTLPSSNFASNGSSYLIAWTVTGGLVASPMALNGTLSFPAGVTVDPTSYLEPPAPPSWDGQHWWVAWRNGFDGIRTARLDAAGTVLDPGGVLVSGVAVSATSSCAVAGLANGAEVAWLDTSVEFTDLRGSRVDGAGGVAAPITLATGAPSQERPDLVATPSGFLAVFTSRVSGSVAVHAQRLDALGQALDPQPLLVASAPDIARARVAFNGTLFLVAWSQGTQILARRMALDGSFPDATPTTVMTGYSPDVAAVGTDFLVVGTNSISYPQFFYPFGRRVSGPSGALLDPAPLLLGGSFCKNPRVIAFEGRWLALWQQNYSHDSSIGTVAMAFVEPDGTVGASSGVAFGGMPHAAARNGQALIVWRTSSDGNQNADIAAQRVLPDGTLVGAVIPLCSLAGEQTWPEVASDGTNYYVAWDDRRNQSAFFDRRTDVYGTRVDPSGTVLDPAGFAWANEARAETRSTLAVRGAAVLWAGSVLRHEAPWASYRIQLRGLLANCIEPANQCGSLPNSTGATASIDSSGAPSLALNAFTLTASGLPVPSNGIFLMGTQPLTPPLPFGNGLRCVGGVIRRLGVVVASGGSLLQTQDFALPVYAGIQPGDVRWFQAWFRDAAAGGAAFNTSDALQVSFCP